jgi:cobalt-zinc-cadmium efflux system outer membrane protein
MTKNKNHLIPVCALLALSLGLLAKPAQAQRDSPSLRPPLNQVPSGSVMTLSQVEQLAVQSNPTLAQAESSIPAAEGRRRQAGLLPNPVVGGEVQNFAFRNLGISPAYLGFGVQTIPLGGKLSKMRKIYTVEVSQAELEASMQRQRVLNNIRNVFYNVLGAQQVVDLQTELAVIARDATTTTSELFNVGQADKPDYLESKIEKEQVEHELVSAQNSYLQSWRALATLLGNPQMTPVRLQGNLEERIGKLDEEQLYRRMLEESPQMKAAQLQIRRAQAVLIRAKAEPYPDLYVRGSLGYGTAFLDSGSDAPPPRTGVVANGQVGMTLPIFNRNPGGIASARAEVLFAEREVDRLRMTLRMQVAAVIREYNTALDAITRYRDVILPSADEAYKLQKTKFEQMSASYPQMLIAQRTRFQLRQKYINALVSLQQEATQVEGFLLSGGLDVPRTQFDAPMEHRGMPGLPAGRYASEDADISSLDEAHNVDHY